MAQVNEIFWIDGPAAPHLAIVLRPAGDQELASGLRRLHEGGIQTIVSLLEPQEADWLGLGNEAEASARAGLQFFSFPIPDTHVPADTLAFRAFVAGLAQRLAAGEHIGVHCRGCIGRATVTAACALIHLGWEPRAALAAVAEARGLPVPDTTEQKQWILNYRLTP